MSDLTAAERDALKDWIRTGIAEKKVSITGAARANGIATTTLSKFLNDPNYTFTPSTPTIKKLERYFGRPAPASVDGCDADDNEADDTHETKSEGSICDVDALPAHLQQAITALKEGRKQIEVWQIHTSALDYKGIIPGDIVLISKGEYHYTNDAVLAMESVAAGGPRPIFRQHEKPFLVSRSASAAHPTLTVNELTVRVVGPIVARLSWHPPRE